MSPLLYHAHVFLLHSNLLITFMLVPFVLVMLSGKAVPSLTDTAFCRRWRALTLAPHRVSTKAGEPALRR